MMRSMHSKKNDCCCLRVIVSLVSGKFYKKMLCILVEVNKILYGNNEDIPKKLMDIFLLGSPGIINHMILQGGFTDPLFTQSYQTILNKQEFIIHNSVTQLVQFSLSTMPMMSTIYDKSGAGWNRINIDDYFKNYFKTSEIGDVVQKRKKSTPPQQFEEDHIQLMTMRNIRVDRTNSNERSFFYSMCVCVCVSWPPAMRGVTVKRAIPIASNLP